MTFPAARRCALSIATMAPKTATKTINTKIKREKKTNRVCWHWFHQPAEKNLSEIKHSLKETTHGLVAALVKDLDRKSSVKQK